MDELVLDMQEKMNKSIDSLKVSLTSLRTGKATPAMLNGIEVDYYGTMTPINQMANIQVPEARMITVSVWDVSQVKNVTKAISMADLGVNPTDDGKLIRLVFPALTEDRRRELVKQVKRLLEDTKIVMRNARRDILEQFKAFKKDAKVSEDEYAGLEKDVQDELDSIIAKADNAEQDKEKQIMEI